MRFVLDNSVAMRWLFGDGSLDDQMYAKQVLASMTEATALVPSIWCLEVANVIVRAEKKFGLMEARSTEFMRALQQMHIQIDPETSSHAMGDIVHIARRYNLSAYDAAYLELALRESLPLATLDDGLINALKKAGAKQFTPYLLPQ